MDGSFCEPANATVTSEMLAEVADRQEGKYLEMPCPMFLSDNGNGSPSVSHIGRFEYLIPK